MRIGFGISTDIDDQTAAVEAVTRARTSLGEAPRAALLYLSTSYDAVTVMRTVRSALGDIPLIGCTSAGMMTGSGTHEDDAAMLVLLGGDIVCTARLATDIGRDSYARARALAEEAIAATPRAKLVLVHPEPLGVDGGEIVRGARDGAANVLVAGGMAGEFSGRGRPRQFFGGEVHQGALPLLAIGGDFTVSSGLGDGWRPVGRRYRITKVEGRAVLGLNDRPVLDVLRDYSLTTGIVTLADTPFAVFERPGATEYSLRAVERADSERGALLFFAGMPLGGELQATLASVDDVLDGARDSTAKAMAALRESEPTGALVFSCTARKWLLASRIGEEATRIATELGPAAERVPVVGLYCHGEVGPRTSGHPALLHNQTCLTVVFGRRP